MNSNIVKPIHLYVLKMHEPLLMRWLSASDPIIGVRPPKVGYPLELRTISDHLRKRRLDLELTQKEAAKTLRVTEDCYNLWECSKVFPQVQHMPKIFAFLEYLPISIDKSTINGRIKYYRNIKGLSLKKMGKLLNVNATTVGAWENGNSIPHLENSIQLEALLSTIF